MGPFLGLFALVVLLAVVSALCGRLLVGLLRINLLRGMDFESLCVSAFLGTGLLALVFGWGSMAGLAAPGCLLLLGALIAAMCGLLACRGRLMSSLRMRLRRRSHVLGLAMLALPVVLYLLPLLRGGYYPINDTLQYVAVAEWLQNNGFGTPCPPDPTQPLNSTVCMFQAINHRMGVIYLLAMTKAAVPNQLTLVLYPAVMAWGVALNVAGVYVLSRWTLRVRRTETLAGTAFIAMLCSSLNWSAHCGFFSQVYGTATLAFGLGVASRCLSRANWSLGNASLLGIVAAIQLSMYSELTPVLGVAYFACIVWVLVRAQKAGRLLHALGFIALALVSLAVVANVECVRTVRSLYYQVFISGDLPMGAHVSWSMWEYAAYALGAVSLNLTLPVQIREPLPGVWGHLAMTLYVICGLLAIAGIFKVRQARAIPLVCSAVALLALGVNCRFFNQDPWTNGVGHTWRLFKVAMWVFPVVAALQVAGLALLLRALPMRRLAPIALTVCLAALTIPSQLASAEQSISYLQTTFKKRQLIAEMHRLQRRIDQLNPSNLVLVREPRALLPWEEFAPYVLFPRPFINSWECSVHFPTPWMPPPAKNAVPFRELPPNTILIQHGRPPFEEPKERLPLNHSLLDGTKPYIFMARTPNGLAGEQPHCWAWVGNDPMQLAVYSPKAGPAVLMFHVKPGPSLPETSQRTIRLRVDGKSFDFTVDTQTDSVVELPLPNMPAGVSQVEMSCADRATSTLPTDPRVMLVAVIAPRILLRDE